MWNRSPKLIHIIMEGGKKTVVNFIRVEAIETIANLANISENRNLMWQNRGCRNVVLSACEVVVLPTNVDTTPPIEAAGLKALGLLTGVKMC
jgi:CHAT domain-containing protein